MLWYTEISQAGWLSMYQPRRALESPLVQRLTWPFIEGYSAPAAQLSPRDGYHAKQDSNQRFLDTCKSLGPWTPELLSWSAAVAIAAEVVSQEKWIWFWAVSSPTRPLRHLQRAVSLIPVVARHSLSTLMAIIVIIQSIGTEYQDAQLRSGTGSLPISHMVNITDNYFRTRTNALYVWWDLEANFRAAIFSSMADPQGNDSTIIPNCITGNCTFPSWDPSQSQNPTQDITHASVGACSDCTNVTSLITEWPATPNMSERYTLPNGLELVMFDSSPYMVVSSQDSNLSWAEKIISPQKAETYRWAFANVTILTTTARNESEDDPITGPSALVATTCSLYPCLTTYSAFVQDNQLHETVLYSTPLYPDVGNYSGDAESFADAESELLQSSLFLTAIQSPCRVGDSFYTMSNGSNAGNKTLVRILTPDSAPNYPSVIAAEGCIYRFGTFIWTLMGTYLRNTLNGTCTWDSRQGNNIECGESWWLAPFWEQKHASVQTIVDRFSAISNAMTNRFRLGLGTAVGTAAEVRGVALQTLPYTVFKWKWLLLPTILLLLETIMLVLMIGRSIRHRGEEMVWKSNLLPLLYYKDSFSDTDDCLPEGDNQGDGTTQDAVFMTSAELEELAKKVRVRLRRGQKNDAGYTKEDVEMEGLKQKVSRVRDLDQDSLIT
ncbi:hypothetical protein F4779DRAFT_632042 [Xylariaceae sp. FL0662B]|nr:hypothetical protein F4779DRAFT_632042 [Xylariaceae sp. FL0662B]